ncbi:hypothetical protein [Lacticaseibacillus sp. GG6-2]
MSRKLERRLVWALGIWQLIDGMITIIGFGTYIKLTGAKGGHVLNYQSAKALNSLFGSLYMFLVIFGVALIGLGLLSIYFAKCCMQDDKVLKGVVWYLFAVAIAAYLCMDVLSVGLAIISAVVALAKNKAIKTQQREHTCYEVRLEENK